MGKEREGEKRGERRKREDSQFNILSLLSYSYSAEYASPFPAPELDGRYSRSFRVEEVQY